MPKDADYVPPSWDELLGDLDGEQALLRALLAAGCAEHEFENFSGMKLTALRLAVFAVQFSGGAWLLACVRTRPRALLPLIFLAARAARTHKTASSAS